MIDFATARRMMVDGQVRTADVNEPRLLSALYELPREHFLPERNASLAYLDIDAPVGEGQGRRLLKPMVFAKLAQLAEIGEGDRVLDVGCATGYSSAVLGHMAGAVIGLEEDPALARLATSNLLAVRLPDVKVVVGPLATGWPSEGPYDAIVLEGATEVVPELLFQQLKDGGRLTCVLGRGPDGKGMLYRSVDGEVSGRPMFDAAAPLLPGFAKPPQFVF
jgi:protein-L-isoaspartate(D-aspartate) O-methyltransferase